MEGTKWFVIKYVEFINNYFKTSLYVNFKVTECDIVRAISCVQAYAACFCVIQAGIFRKIYKKSLIALISPIVIFSLIFIVGLIPEARYIFAFLVGFMPLALSCKENDEELGIHIKAASLISIGFLLIMCMRIVPKTTYERNYSSILSVKDDIKNKIF